MSHERSYVVRVVVALSLAMLVAQLFGGPVGVFASLLTGSAALGSIGALWLSGIAAVWNDRGSGRSRWEVFFAADLDRWAGEGVALGSIAGLVFGALAVSGL